MSGTPPKSALYLGQVRHRRFKPRRHQFRFRLSMAYLDLDELPGLMPESWFWSIKRRALLRFHREDYLGPAKLDLKSAVYDAVETETGRRPAGPVRMLTQLRLLGYVFNPVTFYYCFDSADTRVENIVAEVTNTPWLERHAYVLTPRQRREGEERLRYLHPKLLHVSPFMGMNHEYDWSFSEPGPGLTAHFVNLQGEASTFDVKLDLERREWSRDQLQRLMLRLPFMSFKVTAGIYWQALLLFLKRMPFHRHPHKLSGAETAAAAAESLAARSAGVRPLENRQFKAPGGGALAWLAPVIRRGLFRRLARFSEGRIELREGETRREFGAPGAGPTANIEILDSRFYPALALGASIGAAESYACGYWRSDNLVELLRLFARNLERLSPGDRRLARLMRPFKRLGHWLRRNSPGGSRRNIIAHYDLGNEFYRLWLDESLTYSCAFFANPGESLAEASLRKLDRLCRKLDLAPGDRVLEIGTGWGSFALHAAARYGCRVTTTTISDAQYRFARQRVRERGLEDYVTVLDRDYRDLDGRFDKLVSIEMIEAVGHRYVPDFVAACDRLLEPDGLMAIQAITMAEEHYGTYRRSVDFIQHHVFPGACLLSLAHFARSLGRRSRLAIVDVEDITSHYAETLHRWREHFLAAESSVKELGFDEPFCRLWEYYLAYCEAGFRERRIGDLQILLAGPEYRGEIPRVR